MQPLLWPIMTLLLAWNMAVVAAEDEQPTVAKSDALRRLEGLCQGDAESRATIDRSQRRVQDVRLTIGPIERTIAAQENEIQNLMSELNPRPARGGGDRNRNDRRLSREDRSRVESRLRGIAAEQAQARDRHTMLLADLRQATNDYEKATAQQLKQSEEFWQTADVFGRSPRAELLEMIKVLDDHITAHPDSHGARLARAITHRRLNNTKEALSDYGELCASESNVQTVALVARAELLMAMKRDSRARTDLSLATKLAGKQTDPYLQLYRGWILCGQKRYDAALSELNKARKSGRVDAEVNRLLALIGVHTHGKPNAPLRLNQALEYAERAVELTRKSDWLSLEALAACQYLKGDKEAAAETVALMVSLTTAEIREQCEELARQLEAGEPPIPAGDDPFRVSLTGVRQEVAE